MKDYIIYNINILITENYIEILHQIIYSKKRGFSFEKQFSITTGHSLESMKFQVLTFNYYFKKIQKPFIIKWKMEVSMLGVPITRYIVSPAATAVIVSSDYLTIAVRNFLPIFSLIKWYLLYITRTWYYWYYDILKFLDLDSILTVLGIQYRRCSIGVHDQS